MIAIYHYLEAKFDYGYFIIFLRYGSKILHKKFQVILRKNEGMTAIFLSKFKIQGLDIVTLLGAEGPQQGPQGPRGPKGPPALRRS